MKKTIVLIVIFVLLSISFSFAETHYDAEAVKLKEIGVFKGTGNGFELDRAPSRLEGAVMFVRLLGAESTAIENNSSHPFLDVPKWGSPYVGYLYQQGLTNGISATEFGSEDIMDAKSYLTFMLRALNYDDSNGDFSWSMAVKKSNEIGLIDNGFMTILYSNDFLRDHVAYISYRALVQNIKETESSLANKLVNGGAFSMSAAISMGVISDDSSKLFSEGTPLSNLNESDIVALGADGFTGTDLEIANQIKDWQVENMIYASDSKNYSDVSYGMRWDYAFPGMYTTKDMIENMKDGNKIYGVCFNYAVIFADIANYYDLDVRISNTTVKPSEVSGNPFYSATATGLSPDEYAVFKTWIISKGLNEEDYPYEAVRLVMAETALHYKAEVKIDNEWISLDTYRQENDSASQYTFVETDWQEGNQEELFNGYVERIKNGEDIRSEETIYQTYNNFLEARLIRIEMDELKDYVGITDDLGQAKRAASQDDLLQGYGLIPYFENKAEVLSYMSNLDWLEEEIDEYFELKDALESKSGVKFYVVADIILTPEDDNESISYEVYLEQYLGYTGEDISNELSEDMFNEYIK